MVHLKRLVIGKKIQRRIDFNVELDLNAYIAIKRAPLLYDLIGVTKHIESHKDRHYIARGIAELFKLSGTCRN